MPQSIPTHYSVSLIAASIMISMFAAYAAFCFAERVNLSRGIRRGCWLGGGSLTMGLGIWSMHYLGMLSMSMPVDVQYSPSLVAISFVLAIATSAIALTIVGRSNVQSKQLFSGAGLMGSGIAAMHYTGMAAMQCCARQHYSPFRIALSILVAFCFSWFALAITFRLRDSSSHTELLRMSGASLMGLGIAAMHYTAMGAVTFVADPNMPRQSGGGIRVHQLGAVGVLLTVLLVLATALVTAFLDRVTYRQIREAYSQPRIAHERLVQTQKDLLTSQQALAEANNRLQELSMRDELTQLYNRRYFNEAMETEWRRATREKITLAFLMLDVDHFKLWNDSAGHAVGDKILKDIAQVLNRKIEVWGGVLARYGGEEFATMIPVSDLDQALQRAEELRLAIAAYPMQIQDAPFSSITVSVGIVAATSRLFAHPSAALQAADEALYRAKQLGRNRVEITEFLQQKMSMNLLHSAPEELLSPQR